MRIKRFLTISIIFYILALFQSSFLVHFNLGGFVPNLVLMAVIFLSFFEKPEDYSLVFGSALAGSFLDLFSDKFLGFWVLMLLFISIALKLIFEKYLNLVIWNDFLKTKG